jgi:hypothetical protein
MSSAGAASNTAPWVVVVPRGEEACSSARRWVRKGWWQLSARWQVLWREQVLQQEGTEAVVGDCFQLLLLLLLLLLLDKAQMPRWGTAAGVVLVELHVVLILTAAFFSLPSAFRALRRCMNSASSAALLHTTYSSPVIHQSAPGARARLGTVSVQHYFCFRHVWSQQLQFNGTWYRPQADQHVLPSRTWLQGSCRAPSCCR